MTDEEFREARKDLDRRRAALSAKAALKLSRRPGLSTRAKRLLLAHIQRTLDGAGDAIVERR